MAEDVKQEEQVKRSRGDSGAVARAEDLQPTWTDKDGNVHKKRILTGDRTTGKLHLGHYVGSLRSRVALQSKYDTFILMADVQALTTHWDKPEILKQSVIDVALDYLAIGLNPYTGGDDDGSKVKVVVQSAVPSIAELTVLYGLVTPMSVILDNPTTKSEAQQYGMDVSEDTAFAAVGPDGSAVDHSPLLEFLKKEYKEIGSILPELLIVAIHSAEGELSVSIVEELAALGLTKRITQFAAEELITAAKSSVGFRKHLRDHIIKVKRSSGIRQMNYGFLGYPVSQAADITFVNAHLVPVGDDQVPHIELTRDIVRRMNKQYGGRRRILVEPQALIGGSTLKALDGNAKMSKSLGNAVYLSDDDAVIWSQLKRAVTDPQRIRKDDPGRPEVCNVFAYHQQFSEDTEPSIRDARLNVPTCDETAELCRTAGIGCVDCKKNLAAKLTAMLDPIRERRAKWAKDMDGVMDILTEGTRRGNEEGNETVERVKAAMHVNYWG